MTHDEPSTDWPKLLKAAAFEVRQALISIPGYVRFLQAGRGGPLRDNVLRVVAEIGRAARRVTEAADKLEMLARLEAGRFDQPRVIMSLSETIGLSRATSGVP
jgi:signal transduction histidine kinase